MTGAVQTQGPRPVLVTGAGGLIGHRLVRSLHEAGRPVVAMDRVPVDLPVPTAMAEIGDVHALYRAIDTHDVGSIAHCGGVSGPMLGRENPGKLVEINVGGTRDIAEAARLLAARNGSCRLVFCSSLAVYGNQAQDGIAEDAPLLSTDMYGASKIAAEAILRAYAAQHGVSALSLRITWVYGPRRTTDCVIRTMLEDALTGRPTRMAFGRGFRRQFVHIDDVAAAIRLALDAPAPCYTAYNVSGGVDPTLDEIADIVARVVPGADIALEPGPDPVDGGLGRLDIGRIAEDLGHAPAVALETGIAAYADWLRGQLQKGKA